MILIVLSPYEGQGPQINGKRKFFDVWFLEREFLLRRNLRKESGNDGSK